LPNRSECWWMMPCLARIAWTRFLIAERIRVSVARWRSSSRRSRSSRGAM
jgi:hypothetical protein